jgi:hypothetical protein
MTHSTHSEHNITTTYQIVRGALTEQVPGAPRTGLQRHYAAESAADRKNFERNLRQPSIKANAARSLKF